VLAEGGGIGQEPHAARQAARKRTEFAAHTLDLLDDQPPVLQKALACGRQAYAAPVARQQGHAEGGLHAANTGAR
jgi:hypothetical protein